MIIALKSTRPALRTGLNPGDLRPHPGAIPGVHRQRVRSDGLRQLYFLLGGFLDRLVYLSVGLSIILGFIGIKLILHALHTYHLADWLPFDGEFRSGFR